MIKKQVDKDIEIIFFIQDTYPILKNKFVLFPNLKLKAKKFYSAILIVKLYPLNLGVELTLRTI